MMRIYVSIDPIICCLCFRVAAGGVLLICALALVTSTIHHDAPLVLDGRRFQHEFSARSVVEDPDYLAEALTVSTTWDYPPEQWLLRFACDPEQSRRYQFR